MSDVTDMSTPVTRGELRAEIAQLRAATKADLAELESKLESKLAPLATRAEVVTKADLQIWGDALLKRMTSEIAREIAHNTKVFQEEMSRQFSVIDDKYADLPGRVHRLETTVFTPKRR